jgi:hypothetical protein
MPGYVSVPEKTLEHWSSQYIISRFGTRAALWWPATGEDIKFGCLPARPGKAVQLELKTTTVSSTDPGSHEVQVDIGQLLAYRKLAPGHQPFYAFPWPDWHGKLEDHASAGGPAVTELAFRRSGRGWWFAHWMVVMTTQQVAEVLDAELKRHASTTRGVKKPLVRFRVESSRPGTNAKTEATWGPGKNVVRPPEVVGWADFWPELARCGRDEWPQLIRLPAWAVDAQAGASYSRTQLAVMLKGGVMELSYDQRGGDAAFVTLEPDGDGTYRVGSLVADEPEATLSAAPGQGAEEDCRTAVFVDASEMVN